MTAVKSLDIQPQGTSWFVTLKEYLFAIWEPSCSRMVERIIGQNPFVTYTNRDQKELLRNLGGTRQNPLPIGRKGLCGSCSQPNRLRSVQSSQVYHERLRLVSFLKEQHLAIG